MTPLSQEEILRYSRHIKLPEVGKDGQEKLKGAKVLLIGSGGLSSPNAMYLAAAGVGTLGLVDFDVVDQTNLQRQLLFETSDVGKLKVESAAKRIKGINPHTRVNVFNEKLTRQNAVQIISDSDLVIDGTDNFPTRYLVNDACVFLNKPNVYGSVFRFEGQATFFKPKEGPCYRCLFPEPPPPGEVLSCAEGGVMGILPGLVGMIQASESLKYILGIGNLLIGRFLQINVMEMSFREIKIRRDPECPVCGDKPAIKELIDYEDFCGLSIGKRFPSAKAAGIDEISAVELKKLLDSKRAPQIIDVREPFEFEISRIPGSKLIPLGTLPNRTDELDKKKEYVIHCHTGSRSARAIKQLNKRGFTKLKNLAGGINAYADIDPSIPKY